MKFIALLIASLILVSIPIWGCSCAAKPVDPALMQAHKDFTSKLTLPQ